MNRSKILMVAVLLLGSVYASSAQTGHDASCGLMVMAHGGTDEWNGAILDAVQPLREKIPTSIAFGMADPSTMDEAITELEEHNVNCIAVVRLFMSAHSFLHQTEYLLGLRQDPPPFFITHHGPAHDHSAFVPLEYDAKLKISETALLDASEMGDILALHASALSDSSGTESVLIIAHGSGDDAVNDEWLRKLDRLSDSVRETNLFQRVAVNSLREDWKDKRPKAEAEIRQFVETHSQDDGRVLILPFRLFGFGPYAEVLDGLSYQSTDQGLLPHPKVTEWIERTANNLFAEFNQEL